MAGRLWQHSFGFWGVASLHKCWSVKLSCNPWCPHASDNTGCLKDLSQCAAALLLLPILLDNLHPLLL